MPGRSGTKHSGVATSWIYICLSSGWLVLARTQRRQLMAYCIKERAARSSSILQPIEKETRGWWEASCDWKSNERQTEKKKGTMGFWIMVRGNVPPALVDRNLNDNDCYTRSRLNAPPG
jgi:hypothetical protein